MHEGVLTAACQLYDQRRERDRLLGGYAELMGEPVWDMLLHLLITHAETTGEPLPSSRDAPIYSIHWVAVLQRLGLIERVAALGGQGKRLRLSHAGLELMQQVVPGCSLDFVNRG